MEFWLIVSYVTDEAIKEIPLSEAPVPLFAIILFLISSLEETVSREIPDCVFPTAVTPSAPTPI